MTTEAAQKICEEDTNLNVNIVIRNLKEEAKDDSGESGVDDGEDWKKAKKGQARTKDAIFWYLLFIFKY